MLGRTATPTALKELRGNPGKRALNKSEPKPSMEKPEPPAQLDKEALAEWHRVVDELHKCGLLALCDRAALAAYCANYSRWVAAEFEIAACGLTVRGAHGLIAHPAVAIADKAMRAMKSFLTEFGMTPASRSRIVAGELPEADPLAEFLNGGASGGSA
jgi:P27 family predicted phage terminase small subunit